MQEINPTTPRTSFNIGNPDPRKSSTDQVNDSALNPYASPVIPDLNTSFGVRSDEISQLRAGFNKERKVFSFITFCVSSNLLVYGVGGVLRGAKALFSEVGSSSGGSAFSNTLLPQVLSSVRPVACTILGIVGVAASLLLIKKIKQEDSFLK